MYNTTVKRYVIYNEVINLHRHLEVQEIKDLTMKTKALFFSEKEKIELQTMELDDPGINHVLIEMKACGICTCDLYGFKEGSKSYFGHEGVGIVAKTGPGVTHVKKGDKVFCLHGGLQQMAQMANVQADSVVHIPDEVEDYHLWVGEPIACVVNGIAHLPLFPGARVGLVGAGFMGLLKVQGLAQSLLGELVAFDINDRHLELAKEFGADKTYNITGDNGKKVLEEIKSAGGFDIVVEASGSQGGFDIANAMVKTAGTLSLFGAHRGMRQFDGVDWHNRGISILNTSPMCDIHYFDCGKHTGALMRKGVFNLEPLVTHVSDFNELQDIFSHGLNKTDGYLKGVITF